MDEVNTSVMVLSDVNIPFIKVTSWENYVLTEYITVHHRPHHPQSNGQVDRFVDTFK